MARNNSKRYEKAYANAIKQAQKKGAPNHRPISNMVDGQREHESQEVLRIRTTPIAFGIPMDEILFSKFFVLFIRHANMMPWDAFITTESTYLPDARNEIHNQYLKTDFPYLMMLDSDVLIPPNMVDLLVRHDLPIVGGWYKNKNRLKSYSNHPIVYDYISTTNGVVNWKHREHPGEGLERVDGMGAGCWLMKKEVAEAVGESPYDMNSGGEDMKMSKRILDLGIPMHVDWDLECAHIGVSWV